MSQKEAPKLSVHILQNEVFLGDSRGIVVGLLWDSWGITGVFVGEPWVFLGVSRGFAGDSCGLPRCFLVLLLFY